MLASLPMYARPENRAAHDRLWKLIRDGLRAFGVAAPEALDHDILPWDSWERDDLVLCQICNLPYRLSFRDRVTVIGTADHILPNCAPGMYRSILLARAPMERDALSNARFAYNESKSNSGIAAAFLWAEASGISLRPSLQTGSHRASAYAVAEGRADLAAIDMQTWWMLKKWEPGLNDLVEIAQTDASPGMSFVTAGQQDPAPFANAIDAAISGLSAADRATLNLRGLVRLPASAFDLPLASGYTRFLNTTDAT